MCHINGQHTTSVKNEHRSRDVFALLGIIGLAVQLIDGVVAAAGVPGCLQLQLERNRYQYRYLRVQKNLIMID